MSTDQAPTESPAAPADPDARRTPRRGWLIPLLLRLHFYAGILIGPFILVAALSGAFYALTPTLEKLVYAQELTAPVSAQSQPLAAQVRAAQDVVGESGTLAGVWPAPEPGSTTRVLFRAAELRAGESRAIFIDPGTAQVRGDLTVYSSNGELPLRTWSSSLHSNLNLGEPGRIYSELAASWLGIVVLAGAALWVQRLLKARRKKELLRPSRKGSGYRKLFSWHASLGVWVLFGALFLSATGITWSQFAGENVSAVRGALDWKTPSISTQLDGAAPAEAGGHGGHGAEAASPATVDPADFDRVLGVARNAGIDAPRIQIKVPAAADRAWTVNELEGGNPADADQVAIDPKSFEVTDRLAFADFSPAAKLTKWAIALHMGTLFGLANQILLFLTALGIAAMTVLGYLMWWKRRPTRSAGVGGDQRGGTRLGRAVPSGKLAKAPWWGVLSVVLAGAVLGIFLPLVGLSLIAFVLLDTLVSARRGQ